MLTDDEKKAIAELGEKLTKFIKQAEDARREADAANRRYGKLYTSLNNAISHYALGDVRTSLNRVLLQYGGEPPIEIMSDNELQLMGDAWDDAVKAIRKAIGEGDRMPRNPYRLAREDEPRL